MRFLFKTICVAGMALGVSTTANASTNNVFVTRVLAAQKIYEATISPECKSTDNDLRAYLSKNGLANEYIKTYKYLQINSGTSLEEYEQYEVMFKLSIVLMGSNKCLYEPMRRANDGVSTTEENNEIYDEMIKAVLALGQVSNYKE